MSDQSFLLESDNLPTSVNIDRLHTHTLYSGLIFHTHDYITLH